MEREIRCVEWRGRPVTSAGAAAAAANIGRGVDRGCEAAYKLAAAEQAAKYAQWESLNAQRHKKRKQRNRPDNDGAQATKRRLESEELLERHREREQERRSAAEPEPTAEEVQEAERAIKYGKKRRLSAKALAAAQANLQVTAALTQLAFSSPSIVLRRVFSSRASVTALRQTNHMPKSEEKR